MSANKTQPTKDSVKDFLNKVKPEQKRKDAFEVLDMMEKLSGEKPVLWGPSLVGFGTYHYKYDSGREGDFFRVGFSPRKTALTIYIMPGFEQYSALMESLGKYKTGKSCLYVKKMEDIDRGVLETLIIKSLEYMKEKYG